jgi:uncharacterized protein YndB with AHSA1/START domain
MEKPDFVYVIFIEASPEAVWQGLTSPDFTEKYWGGLRIESTWEPGAPVRHLRGGVAGLQGEVLEADPPRRLSYTFHMKISPAHEADPPSRVTFEIEQMAGMSKLTLRHHHERAGSATQETTSHGWPAILSSLKSLLETGKPLPFKGLGFGPSDAGREGTR